LFGSLFTVLSKKKIIFTKTHIISAYISYFSSTYVTFYPIEDIIKITCEQVNIFGLHSNEIAVTVFSESSKHTSKNIGTFVNLTQLKLLIPQHYNFKEIAPTQNTYWTEISSKTMLYAQLLLQISMFITWLVFQIISPLSSMANILGTFIPAAISFLTPFICALFVYLWRGAKEFEFLNETYRKIEINV